MLDIKFLRENPDIVKQNIKNKFQDRKLPMVDEVIELDKERRETQQKADDLRALRKKNSKMIGALMGQGKKEEAEAMKAEIAGYADELAKLEKTTVRMWRFRNMASRLFRILKCHIIQRLWRSLTASIWMQRETLPVTVSTI